MKNILARGTPEYCKWRLKVHRLGTTVLCEPLSTRERHICYCQRDLPSQQSPSCAPQSLYAGSKSACKISSNLTPLPSLPERNQITCNGVKLPLA